MLVNDTFRTVADQYLFHRAGVLRPGQSGCLGGPLTGGQGRHETGVAVDIDNSGAFGAGSATTCCQAVPDDSVHYECRPGCALRTAPNDPNDLQVRRWGVEAFQILWNANHPGDQITVDGAFGEQTASRLRASPAGGFAVGGCEPDRDGDGYAGSLDCNDGDRNIHVGAPERCNNVDDDCDRMVDEAVTRPCGGGMGACSAGVESCSAGTWSECVGGAGPSREVCDGADNDCDGAEDEEQVCSFEAAAEQAGDSRSSVGHSDVDGDGRADVCALVDRTIQCALSSERGFGRIVSGPTLSTATDTATGGALTFAASVRTADVDGDRRADLCMIAQPDARALECWALSATAAPRSLGAIRVNSALTNVLVVDLDGDDRSAELCVRSAEGLSCYRYARGEFAQSLRLSALSDAEGFADPQRFGSIRMGDLDGDRRADVCARQADGVRCWRAGDREFSPGEQGPRWSDELGFSQVALWSTMRMADLDGDGRAELCARQPDQRFACHSWADRQFSERVRGPTLQTDDGWSDPSTYRTLSLGDIDGDGAADLCARELSGLRCWLWTGREFGRVVLGPAALRDPVWLRAERFRSLRLADVSGDGRSDVCARHADGLQCYVSNGADFSQWVRTSLWSDATSADRLPLSISMQSAGSFGPARPGAGCACAIVGARARDRAAPHGAARILSLLGLLAWATSARRTSQRKSHER